MRKSNEEKPMDIIDFAQELKGLTPKQVEVIGNLINALYDVQEELKKVDNAEGEKVVNS
jgi:hypothetical protein